MRINQLLNKATTEGDCFKTLYEIPQPDPFNLIKVCTRLSNYISRHNIYFSSSFKEQLNHSDSKQNVKSKTKQPKLIKRHWET